MIQNKHFLDTKKSSFSKAKKKHFNKVCEIIQPSVEFNKTGTTRIDTGRSKSKSKIRFRKPYIQPQLHPYHNYSSHPRFNKSMAK